jgi:hypothetical protein
VVSKTTLLPESISKLEPVGIGASLSKNAVVFAVLPEPPRLEVSLTSLTLTVTCAVCMFDNIKPRITVVVLPPTVYKASGVPAEAGIVSKVTTLNVFAIFFSYYPNAMARAVASSVVAIVPAVLGKVKVISAVEAGPIKVALLVPLSESSKNSTKPAEVDPFFTDIPALNTSLPAEVDTPVCVVAPETVNAAAIVVPARFKSVKASTTAAPDPAPSR